MNGPITTVKTTLIRKIACRDHVLTCVSRRLVVLSYRSRLRIRASACMDFGLGLNPVFFDLPQKAGSLTHAYRSPGFWVQGELGSRRVAMCLRFSLLLISASEPRLHVE